MNLATILKGVSRSFYLSLRFLPARVRPTISLAFLACKAADTITDTKLLPLPVRLTLLRQYKACFPQDNSNFFFQLSQQVAEQADNPSERDLLLAVPELFHELRKLSPFDLKLICDLVDEITTGMILDLERFPADSTKNIQSLQNMEELDAYTYSVAGCVGLFWTRILKLHFDFARRWPHPDIEQTGIDFGKGLQLVNILRDLPHDLQNGRCYLPEEKLAEFGLSAKNLLNQDTLQQAKPLLNELIQLTQQKLNAGTHYAAQHPWHTWRLKWVVVLPQQLGTKTLNRLKESPLWLNPQMTVKVPRKKVYQLMLTSLYQACRFSTQQTD